MQLLMNRVLFIGLFLFVFSMCVPPKDGSDMDFAKEKARLDSLRDVRCPRLMSSAAEYYRNRDWKKSNRGRRLDHIWVTKDLAEHYRDHSIYRTTRDFKRPSDHVPVMVEV